MPKRLAPGVLFDESKSRWRFRKWHELPDHRTRVRLNGTPTANTAAAAETALRDEALAVDDAFRAGVLEISPDGSGRYWVRGPASDEPSSAPMTFGKYAERWIDEYPASVNNRATTVTEKKSHLRLYLRPALDDVALSEIDSAMLKSFFADLAEGRLRNMATGKVLATDLKGRKGHTQGVSPKTRKNLRSTLRTLLSTAVDDGLLRGLPKAPKIKIDQVPIVALELSECDKLYAAALDEHDRALLMFAVKTGARQGEQMAVTWSDIDFRRMRIILNKAMPRGGPVAQPKAGHRVVNIAPDLGEALKAIKGKRAGRVISWNGQKASLVFVQPNGDSLTPSIMNEKLWSALARAGVRRVHWHALRHTFGTRMAEVAPLPVVQKLMGHTTIQMTMKYVHPGADDGAKWIAAIDRHGDTQQ